MGIALGPLVEILKKIWDFFFVTSPFGTEPLLIIILRQ